MYAHEDITTLNRPRVKTRPCDRRFYVIQLREKKGEEVGYILFAHRCATVSSININASLRYIRKESGKGGGLCFSRSVAMDISREE